ncbi:MAG: ABC transporter ATP-binding protein [Bdellovibrionales bacterium]|nr:ABC transporter ATP-binding protein [Bdellovibrionales bacterium]
MASPLIVEHLIKEYGALRAVDDVSFTLEPGEVFGLLGPNGAGKTSIISTIVTLERPTAGSVRVFGHDVTREPRAAKVAIGFVPQELVNHGFFDVSEVLSFHSGYYGLAHNREREDYLLERLGLWEHRHKKVKQLSGGMKRRLLIAKALVHRPRLLLLDEPTAGVDVALRESLWEFTRELRSEGLTVLLTTHYLQEAEELCDRVGVIHQGRLKQIGDTQSLIASLTHRQVCVQLKEARLPLSHPLLTRQQGCWLEFQLPYNQNLGSLLLEAGLELSALNDLRITEGTLEEVFRLVVGGKV